MADITTGLSRFVLMHGPMPGLLPQLSNADAGPETNVALVRFGERQGVQLGPARNEDGWCCKRTCPESSG